MIIGLCGYAGSGKSTVARFLEENLRERGFREVHRLSFSAPLKRACMALYGLTEEQVDTPKGKNTPDPRLGDRTPREILQFVGTDLIRKRESADFFVHRMRDQMAGLDRGEEGKVAILVDDVRFPNEVEFIRERGGKVLRVYRPGVEAPPGAHVSETAIKGVFIPIILNDKDTLEGLREDVLRMELN